MREPGPVSRVEFAALNAQFHFPITIFDCGRKCAPDNKTGVPGYLQEFIAAYELIFERVPGEREIFFNHSQYKRSIFTHLRRAIQLLHRIGGYIKISPTPGKFRCLSRGQIPTFGVDKIAARMPSTDKL